MNKAGGKFKMVKPEKYDFSGWATKNNIRCSDGRTIKPNAFAEQDGSTVPLVWNHNHVDADNVLGHAILENRGQGVYAYCYLNNTEQGNNARELVSHGDICALSIFANQLKQNGGDVIHGAIREVSLVLAGANPGAKIENVMSHGENCDEEAIIYNDNDALDLQHSEEDKKMEEKKEEPKTEEEKTVKDVIDSMTEEQKNVMYALIGEAIEQTKAEKAKESNEEEKVMKHNAFEKENENEQEILSHSELNALIKEAKDNGKSLKNTFLAHGVDNTEYLEHSITNVGNLFPEAQLVDKVPALVSRDMDWVSNVMGAVKHTPFSRVKSTYANITGDEARAKGYVKGNQKVEEVITALKRTTDPQTVYKLQKMDRDDVIDITDFDVVAWIKGEMRIMLNEELARAILIGDGRESSSNDKINPLHIRPVLGDDATYTIKRSLVRAENETDEAFAKDFIHDVIRSRKDYKGSGNPTLYTTEDMLTSMLLIEDTTGRIIYDTMDKLKTALRVKDIVTVPVMEGVSRKDGENTTYNLMGILVNLNDYNVGADKGGSVNMFDDFDINYNKYEYLIETRCSGALVKPYSAISFEEKVTAAKVGG